MKKKLSELKDNISGTRKKLAERRSEDPMAYYVRRNIWMTFFILVPFIIILGIAGAMLADEMYLITNYFYLFLGPYGLVTLFFITETFIVPLPPDLLLVIVANSDLSEAWWIIVPVMALVSVIGGNLGMFLGRRIGNTRYATRMLGRFRERETEVISRYGAWAVVLGAATPIPFSVTCWMAGILHMRWGPFFWASLFRIPRIFIYYFMIRYATEITSYIPWIGRIIP